MSALLRNVKFASTRLKLHILIGSVILATTCLFALGIILLANVIASRAAEQTALTAARIIGPYTLYEDLDGFEDVLRTHIHKHGLERAVKSVSVLTNEKGLRNLYGSLTNPDREMHLSDSVRYMHSSSETAIFYPIDLGDNDRANLVLAVYKGRAASLPGTGDPWPAIVIGLLGCVSIGAVIFLIREINAPFKLLNRSTNGIRTEPDDTDIELPVEYSDFRGAGAAIEAMVKRMNSLKLELEETRENLETEVRERTRELQEGKERFRVLVETAPDAIVVVDVDTAKFIDANNNACELYGLSRDKLLKVGPVDVSPRQQPDGRWSDDVVQEHIEKASQGESMVFEWIHTRSTGEEIECEIRLVRFPYYGQNLVRGSVTDISERKQAEKEKRELQEKLDRARRMESLAILAGGVAHDLNNMLGPIVAYPDLILLKLPGDSPVRNDIQKMGSAALEAAEVIQDLLSLARRGRYEMMPVNINEVVEHYLESASASEVLSRKPSIEIETALDPEIGVILGSASHLAKIIMNLFLNAVDACESNGKIVIQTSQTYVERLVTGYDKIPKGEYVQLRIRDTGVGIPPEDLKRIFEPYFSKKKMGRSGSGLGLAVVYGIVKDHDGYYDVISNVGFGTEFILYFPLANIGNSPIPAPDIESIEGTERIVVVDDVQEQRDVARRILESLGYEVEAVASGKEALAYLESHDPELMVIDMIMEDGFDGLDTYREVLEATPGMKAVIVSGYSATERVDEMRKLGAGAYVRKPYTRKALGQAVRMVLDGNVSEFASFTPSKRDTTSQYRTLSS